MVKVAPGMSSEARQLVYNYLNQKDLILKVSKLSRQERKSLKDRVSQDGYALMSSINKKKTIFNS